MIELKDIKKTYKMGDEKLDILKGINLKIEQGDFIAIMGPSGSGKSTLMNIIGLLDVPSGGSYQLNGIQVSEMAEEDLAITRRNEIGFIFQQFNLLPRLTAIENVAMPLLYSKKFLGTERAQKLLKQVGLENRMFHKSNELSGGQQQRVAIARALVNEPKIILADEPTGNLDSHSQKDIMKALRELNHSGMTVVLVTHEEDVAREAKRLIRMRDGAIQSDVRVSEFSASQDGKSQFQPYSSQWTDFWNYFLQGYRKLCRPYPYR